MARFTLAGRSRWAGSWLELFLGLSTIVMLAMILTCLSARLWPAPAATIAGRWDPPTRYSHKYLGEVSVVPVESLQQLWRACRAPVIGCATDGMSGHCKILLLGLGASLLDGRPLSAAGFHNILRHELGHCNGWPASHPS